MSNEQARRYRYAVQYLRAASRPLPDRGQDTLLFRYIRLVLEQLRDYEDAITWDTTCLNCSHLLDRLYELEVKHGEI